MQEKQDLQQRLVPVPQQPPRVIVKSRKDSIGFFSQSGLLIYKNFILTIKNPKNIIFLIITPILLSLFLFSFQDLAQSNGKKVIIQPPTKQVPMFPNCRGNDCVALRYATISSKKQSVIPPWAQSTINFIQKKSGIQPNKFSYYNNTLVTQKDLQTYYDFLVQNKNKTQIGLIFCADKSEDIALGLFCNQTNQTRYFILLNKTDSLSVLFHDPMEPMPVDPVALSLKMLVDNAILKHFQNDTNNTELQIEYTTSQFPVGPNRYIDNYDLVSDIGAFYYMITPLFAFLFIQSQIVREKEYKLRQGLNIFGAKHSAYWFSWFIIANLYSLVVSLSTYLAGLAFGFGFFRQTPFYIIIFFLFYPFTLAMQMMSFFLSTLSPTLKAANAISYGIVLFAIVIQSFVSNNNLLVFIFSDDASALVQFLKYFLLFYPPFSYTKFFTNITQYSGYHFDILSRKWVENVNKYSIDQFTKQTNDKLPFGGGTYTRYSDLYSMLVMLGNAVFFIILTWYFDNVIESNRGRGESPFFPFKRIYNLFKKNTKTKAINNSVESLKSPNYLIHQQEQSTIRERNRVIRNANAKLPALGIRIKALNKTFKTLFSKNRVEAVKNFNLEIQPNELMGILGHNGAGKTTLINILTGVINPDDNPELEIVINNQPISKIDEIRKHIGVCSQFDILWGQLTAYDHLYLFARLKNIPVLSINTKIDQMLGFVNLLPQKFSRVSSFSGGMKRRLSLAISAIGNPKIILLDEPTTGLDPKVRQQVWELIQKLKKNKSIILTTHSMEQADILADRVCVMVEGRLKCVGTSFYLKHKYGEGHRITLNIQENKCKETFGLIQKLFPKAILVDSKGGNLIIGLSDYQSLLDMIKMLENKDSSGLDQYSIKQSIKDWNVSHSTLEEVFMKVTKKKEE